MQVVLLVLFLNPLCKRAREFDSSNQSNSNNNNNIDENKNTKKYDDKENQNKNNANHDDFNNARRNEQQRKPISAQLQNERKSSTQKENFERSLKKWTTLSLVCILTDTASALIIALSHHGYYTPSSTQILYVWVDFSVVINVLCMTGSFSEWSRMLFPFWSCGAQRRNSCVTEQTDISSVDHATKLRSAIAHIAVNEE